jgi:hypothetical protein
VEVSLARKILRRRKPAEKALAGVDIFLKPKRLRRKRALMKPTQQRLSITTYSPKETVKNTITEIYGQMTKTYGNLPLWIKYYALPSSVSWNLGSVQATHNLHVYGEAQFTNEFLSRLGEMLKQPLSNNLESEIQTVNQNPLRLTQKTLQGTSSMAMLPAAIQKTDKKTSLGSNLLGTSGLIAGLAGVVLAMSFFSNRRSNNSKKNIAREEALQNAIKSVSDLTTSTPVLRFEEYTGKEWHFHFSDYTVTVTNRGLVTEVNRVEEK